MFQLTSLGVGKRLALTIDDVVLSAPTVRSAISRKFIIEVSDAGWSEAELDRMISILGTEPLPCPLVEVPR